LDDDELKKLSLKSLELKRFQRLRQEFYSLRYHEAIDNHAPSENSSVASSSASSKVNGTLRQERQDSIDEKLESTVYIHSDDSLYLQTSEFSAAPGETFIPKYSASYLNNRGSNGSVGSGSERSFRVNSLPSERGRSYSRTSDAADRIRSLSRTSDASPMDRFRARTSSDAHIERVRSMSRSSELRTPDRPFITSPARAPPQPGTVALLVPKHPITLPSTHTLLAVCREMRAKNENCAIITRGRWVAGIISSRKIVTTVLVDENTNISVSDVMVQNPKCLSMEGEATDALIMMIDHNYRKLPVLDTSGNVVALLDIWRCVAGVIAKFDRVGEDNVLAMTSSPSTATIKIPKLLPPEVDSMFRENDLASVLESRDTLENDMVLETDTVREAARKMSITSRAVAVVNDEGNLVGVFTPRDLVNRVVAKGRSLSDVTVKTVMSGDPEWAPPSTIFLNALYQFHDCGVLHLVVVNDSKKVLGMVNVSDIINSTVNVAESQNRDTWRSFFASAYGIEVPTPQIPLAQPPKFPNPKFLGPDTPLSLISPASTTLIRQQHQDSFDIQRRISLEYAEANAVRDVVRGHWKCGKAIGAGSFGHVFQGLNTQTGELIAVKFLRVANTAAKQGQISTSQKSMDMSTVEAMAAADVSGKGGVLATGTNVSSDVGVRRIHSEVELMEGLRHPNIVRYLGAELYTDSVEHRLYILQVKVLK
jgi:CBS domain-containing protein